MPRSLLGVLVFFCSTVSVAGNTRAPAITLYYSVESAPGAAVWSAMQAEVSRIFDPALISIEWRSLSPAGADVESELFVIRFRGSCSAENWPAAGRAHVATGGFPLANSMTSDGRVLPFADVDCAALKKYLAGEQSAGRAQMLGKAMARVLSHEIYHMLTGSVRHAHDGIARAEQSRYELTTANFSFGQAQINWLREWSGASTAALVAVTRGDDSDADESESGR